MRRTLRKTLLPAAAQAIVNITLVRFGEVNGRVLDEDNARADSGARSSCSSADGGPTVARTCCPTGDASTNAEGRFRIPSVRPGEYIATVRERIGIQAIDKFSASDLAKIDDAYPDTYWPGDADATNAFGVQVASGGYADVGTIFTRKAPQYRVHVTMQGGCADGEVIAISILKRNGGLASPLSSHPCGSQLLLQASIRVRTHSTPYRTGATEICRQRFPAPRPLKSWTRIRISLLRSSPTSLSKDNLRSRRSGGSTHRSAYHHSSV